MEIGYTVVDSSLGAMLVATTADGVCKLALADTEQELVAELRASFPQAKLVENGDRARAYASTIATGLASGRTPAVPLDVGGTAFQRDVWRALETIPAGETRTYSELAKSVGKPAAVRAVARACAGNPVALVVPCHRVIRSDGSLGGYRWGMERKRALLDMEAGRDR